MSENRRPARPSRNRGTLSEIDLARGWIEWLARSRNGYLNALLRLSDVQRTQDRGASFPSIEDIFLHIVDNNLWWFESVPGNRQAEHQRPLGPLSPQQLRALTRRIARIDRTFSASLTPQGLRRRIVVNGIGGDGQPYRMTVSLRTVVWHLIEEELQHRGEMNALFWQLDVEAPTDAWFSSPLAR